jgi:hypothetical protein
VAGIFAFPEMTSAAALPKTAQNIVQVAQAASRNAERMLVRLGSRAVFFAFMMALSAHASAAPTQIALIPMPRQVTSVPNCALSLKGRPLTVPSSVDVGGLEMLSRRAGDLRLATPRVDSNPIVSVTHTQGRPESYALQVSGAGIRIAAADAAGEMDALATLAQLLRATGDIRCVQVNDEPALRDRFFSDDVSRGSIPTMETIHARLERLASYKINGYSLYLENVVRRPGHEDETRADAFTPDELRQVAAWCARFHMTFVPEQETLGHLSGLLESSAYRDVREIDDGTSDVISPAAPRTYSVLRELLTQELGGVPNLKYIHIGGDEPFQLGKGRTAALVRAEGYDRVYGEHMAKVAAIVRSLGARPMMWGDEVVRHPGIMRYLPRDMIVVPYDYYDDPTLARFIAVPRDAGFQVLAAPSVSNFGQFFPDLPTATTNIDHFVEDAKNGRALGMFLTSWIATRDELFDNAWYPIAFGAARAWERAADPDGTFCLRYGELTFGDANACRVYQTFGELADDSRHAFGKDTPETLVHEDWRVPYLRKRLNLSAALRSRVDAHTAALVQEVSLVHAGDPHEVAALQLAAMRYRIFGDVIDGTTPPAAYVARAQQLHLAEWYSENRSLSPTDQIEADYTAVLPPDRAPAVPIPLPQSAHFSDVWAELVSADPPAASPTFLTGDPIALLTSPGISVSQGDRLTAQVAREASTSSGDEEVYAARYIDAAIERAEMPQVIRRDYAALLTMTRRSHQEVINSLVLRIEHGMFAVVAGAENLRSLPTLAPDASAGLAREERRARSEISCFETYVQEWHAYGDAPDSRKNDSRANLPRRVSEAFCAS